VDDALDCLFGSLSRTVYPAKPSVLRDAVIEQTECDDGVEVEVHPRQQLHHANYHPHYLAVVVYCHDGLLKSSH